MYRTTNNSTRLLASGVSVIVSALLLTAATDTAFARPMHHNVKDKRETSLRIASAECAPARGPSHLPSRRAAMACKKDENVKLAVSRTADRK